jgi:hypothetical protein
VGGSVAATRGTPPCQTLNPKPYTRNERRRTSLDGKEASCTVHASFESFCMRPQKKWKVEMKKSNELTRAPSAFVRAHRLTRPSTRC